MFKRYFSLVLSLAVLISFAGCGSRKVSMSEEIIVKEDDPWYESTRFLLEPDSEIEDTEVATYINTACSGDHIYALYDASDSTNNTNRQFLSVYDLDGNGKDIELNFSDDEKLSCYAISVLPPIGDEIMFFVRGFYEDEGFVYHFGFAKMDLKTGKMSAPDFIDEIPGTYWVDDCCRVGGYNVINLQYDNGSRQSLFVCDGTDFLSEFKINGEIGDDYFMSVDAMAYDADSDEITVNLSTNTKAYKVNFDPHTGRLVGKEESDLRSLGSNEDMVDYKATAEGERMIADSIGNIYRYNSDEKKAEKVLDHNCYSPYLSDYKPGYYTPTVLSFDDERVILSFVHRSCSYLYKTELITVLKKADRNPHAGKKVIEMTAEDEFSEYLSSAIYNFNRTDSEYLIRIWDKEDSMMLSKFSYLHDADRTQKESALIESLSRGDAPDIVLNMQNTRAFKDDLLVDLTDFTDPEIRDRLYGNILDACRYEDRLYFMPVTVEINGIIVPEETVGEGQKGFTFDGYEKFVKEKSNGVDPYSGGTGMYYDRNAFLLSCLCIKDSIDGRVDFGNDQFRLAAEYAEGHFPKERDPEMDNMLRQYPCGNYKVIGSFLDYARSFVATRKPYVILGTPSTDGRGPSFAAGESISVTAVSEVKDGIKRFADYLYGGSFVYEELPLDSICINRDILKYELSLLTEENNTAVGYFISRNSEHVNKVLQYEQLALSSDVKEEQFLKAMEELSVYVYNDPEIEMIIGEEVEPFFHGDRSLDDVIRYINDRVGTVLSERNG